MITLFGIERDGRIIDTAPTADLAEFAALDCADAANVPLSFYAVVEVCGEHPDTLADECPEHGDAPAAAPAERQLVTV